MAVAGLALVVGFASILVQGMLLHCGVAHYLIPQFIVLVVVFLAFYEVSLVGAFSAFGLGLLMDLASAQSLGPWAGACVAVYGVFVLLSQRLFIDSSPVAVVIASVAVAVAQILYFSIEPTPPDFSWSLFGNIILCALCSGVFAPILFSFLNRRVGKASPPLAGRSVGLTLL